MLQTSPGSAKLAAVSLVQGLQKWANLLQIQKIRVHPKSSFLHSFMKARARIFTLSILSFLLLAPRSGYTQEQVKLKEVKISGNLRVEEEAIRLHIKTRPGEIYNPPVVEKDVKSIFRMGFLMMSKPSCQQIAF